MDNYVNSVRGTKGQLRVKDVSDYQFNTSTNGLGFTFEFVWSDFIESANTSKFGASTSGKVVDNANEVTAFLN
jgi:hypothetical protein